MIPNYQNVEMFGTDNFMGDAFDAVAIQVAATRNHQSTS
jgi:hypothetical protein